MVIVSFRSFKGLLQLNGTVSDVFHRKSTYCAAKHIRSREEIYKGGDKFKMIYSWIWREWFSKEHQKFYY
jgi:hypothetical protein